MNINQKIYKQVMLMYENDKNTAKKIKKKRTEEIYNKIPEIKELDDEISSLSIKVSRLIMQKVDNKDKILEDLKEENKTLKQEKRRLLVENGFSPAYLDDLYYCTICKDTGFLDTKKCKCFEQRIIKKYYELFNMTDVLQTENFDTFDIRYYSTEVNKKHNVSPRENIENIHLNALKFVENFDFDKKNLLLTGNTGLGKTFLCNCIAKELLDKGNTVLYLTAPKLFKLIESYRFDKDMTHSQKETISLITDVDLLIIDDLGTEFLTILTQSETFNFINSRILENKSTIISTNFNMKELEERYSDRIISRIIGHYEIYNFFGEDIRYKKQH